MKGSRHRRPHSAAEGTYGPAAHSLRSRPPDVRHRNGPGYPAGSAVEAGGWESLLHGGEAARVSPADRECDTTVPASVGHHGSGPDASPPDAHFSDRVSASHLAD